MLEEESNMVVSDGMVVVFDCIIKDIDGQVLEHNQEQPDVYIHGVEMALPALEKELEGHEKGYAATVILQPEESFGYYDDEFFLEVPLEQFDGEDIFVGREFLPPKGTDDIVWRVVRFDTDKVVLDGNHSNAGKVLIFEMKILDVRPATDAELESGLVNLDS